MDLWTQGFSINGKYRCARFCGTFETDSLKMAVRMYMDSIESAVEKRQFNLTAKPPTYWGCKFFDNEVEAREKYG